MDIYEIMDCIGCESRQYRPGRTWGDPDDCYPDEETCKQDAPDSGPCRRMLGAIEDLLDDGELHTHSGKFWTRDCLEQMQKDGGSEDRDMPEILGAFDFSSAPFFYIGDDEDKPTPYNSITEIYNDWFREQA